MWINIEDFWPPADTLMGMEFDTDEELQRCRAILAERPEAYSWVVPKKRFVAVRKRDRALFTDAGLQFTEVKIVDRGDRPLTEEEKERHRKELQEIMDAWRERGWRLE